MQPPCGQVTSSGTPQYTCVPLAPGSPLQVLRTTQLPPIDNSPTFRAIGSVAADPMELTELTTRNGSNATSRRPQPGETQISTSGKLVTYGYHNTFYTHAKTSTPVGPPPSYDSATSPQQQFRTRKRAPSVSVSEQLPDYDCTVQLEGFLSIKSELDTPFLVSLDTNWHPIYAVLCGTKLSIYRTKSPPGLFKVEPRMQGRLLKTYSLQHAEIGLAADHDGHEFIPRSFVSKMYPKSKHKKLWEMDPHLFEPMREYVIRLRLEGQQFLLCADTHAIMLDWLEELGAGIDIAQPLEDRSEPRYRTTPRRTRRQRQLEASALENRNPLTNEELEMRLIAQQQRLFRRLYPNLAATTSADNNLQLQQTTTSNSEVRQDLGREGGANDADGDDPDPADAREDGGEISSSRPATSQRQMSLTSQPETSEYDPKTTPERAQLSLNATCRLRRRFAPILLASSPPASSIIFQNGHRLQLDAKKQRLLPFEILPPRYDAPTSTPLANLTSALGDDHTISRPTLDRGITTATYASGSSQWSNGSAEEEQGEHEHDGISVHSSGTGELSRVSSTVAGKSNESAASGAKGKKKAIFLQVRKMTMPMKSGLSAEEQSQRGTSSFMTPLLV